jgi:hypothetical protein
VSTSNDERRFLLVHSYQFQEDLSRCLQAHCGQIKTKTERLRRSRILKIQGMKIQMKRYNNFFLYNLQPLVDNFIFDILNSDLRMTLPVSEAPQPLTTLLAVKHPFSVGKSGRDASVTEGKLPN